MAEKFNIMLAGQVIGVQSIYSEVRDLCRDYLTDNAPDFIVSTTPEDIEKERRQSEREAELEGRKPEHYSDSYLETLAVYRKIADGLLDYDVLLFHGSVIAVDGIGYMFTAKSGTGKSTHARLWRQHFGDRAVMVNDDKPLLKIMDNAVVAYGTPWGGKHYLSNNISAPLKAIGILSRSKGNCVKIIDKLDALPMLCQQSYRPKQKERMIKALSLINKLGNLVGLYQLECNMDPDAAVVSFEGLNGDEYCVKDHA